MTNKDMITNIDDNILNEINNDGNLKYALDKKKTKRELSYSNNDAYLTLSHTNLEFVGNNTNIISLDKLSSSDVPHVLDALSSEYLTLTITLNLKDQPFDKKVSFLRSIINYVCVDKKDTEFLYVTHNLKALIFGVANFNFDANYSAFIDIVDYLDTLDALKDDMIILKRFITNDLNSVLMSLGFSNSRTISDLNRDISDKTTFITKQIFIDLGLIYCLKFISQNFKLIDETSIKYYIDAGDVFIQAEQKSNFKSEICNKITQLN